MGISGSSGLTPHIHCVVCSTQIIKPLLSDGRVAATAEVTHRMTDGSPAS